MKKAARRNDWSFLPNLLTTGNLLSGAASLYFALQGEFLWAGMCIYLGMIMDVLDGFTAQRLGIATPFGIEYDSLADFLTFGVAPAFLAYRYALAPLNEWGWVSGAAYMTATALRLARFNVYGLNAPSDKTYFQGLPSPAAAGVLVGVLAVLQPPLSLPAFIIVAVLPCALGVLMISRVPFPHMQYLYRRMAAVLGPLHLLGLAVAGILLIFHPRPFLAILFGSYVLLGLLRHLVRRLRLPSSQKPHTQEGRTRRSPGTEEEEGTS